MLKTQITGAKYLSPQTNQMTNLNIAVPADSKDTKFGTSDILLAKDVVAYLNALDSDISNELDAQTDKINKINESIKLLIDHNLIKVVTELPTTDIDKNCIYLVPNKDGEGNNIFIEYIYVESKNTFEEVGRIQAKVDLSDYYTKEEIDNLILIAKNSAINIHNEDNTKSIKLDINDTKAEDEYASAVNINLIDNNVDYGHYIANINACDGFIHKINELFISSFNGLGLFVSNESYHNGMNAYEMLIGDNNETKTIYISTDIELTEEEQDDGYSPVDLSLNDGDDSVRINTKHGIILKDEGKHTSELNKYALNVHDANYSSYIGCGLIEMSAGSYPIIRLIILDNESSITLGQGYEPKFKISCPIDNTEGATITGVKSLTAFSDPSATKVWATDGSTVDLTTKANASDVLLKKSASGGYYIEKNSNALGWCAFAANLLCTASGSYSHAEGVSTEAIGTGSHAEGNSTKALGHYAHAEGETTKALGNYSHAEGQSTTASGDCSHAEGCNTDAKRCSHAEGNYTHAVGTYTHAEGEYTSANGSYSHAEGFGTYSNGNASHSEGYSTKTNGHYSHAEGNYTEAAGFAEHALGTYNVVNKNAIHSVGIGNNTTRKNAEYIYAKSNENSSNLVDDPKNGYKYLIGVGGYDGINTDNSTYKSVQEVIADLTARIEQLETKVRALEAANTPA